MDPMVREMQAEIQMLKIEVAGAPRTSPKRAMKDWTGDIYSGVSG